jgi:hypothetical protein
VKAAQTPCYTHPVPEESSKIELQERDLALMRGLFESRVMTLSHIGTLYFGGSLEAAKKRAQKLKAAGFLSEKRRRVNEPSLVSLAPKSFSVLKDEGMLDRFPKLSAASLAKRTQVGEFTLRHELEVLDVKCAFANAISKRRELSLEEFSTWPRLSEFNARVKGKEFRIQPDGFVRIQEKEPNDGLSEHTLFLEVDRSTESQETLARKSSCYLDYYRSGGFSIRNGKSASAYKDFPFRVLIVCKSEARRNNAAEELLRHMPPILSLAWITTFREATENPLGSIWIRPMDYRGQKANAPKQILLS